MVCGVGGATGTQLVLLSGAEGAEHQSPHGSGEALTGELALLGPCLGWSQRLLNRDHHAAYYQVQKPPCAHSPLAG